jgi:hypothetical protein
MQAGPCRQAELGHRRVIVQHVAGGVGGGVEEQQEAVGAVDLAPVVAAQQVARPPVVLGPQGEGALVAEALCRQRAVDGIGEQQRDDLAHRLPGGRPFWRFRQGPANAPPPNAGGAGEGCLFASRRDRAARSTRTMRARRAKRPHA